MPYPYYQMQPYPTAYPQGQQLVRVTGVEGAKAYQMPPNSMMALFDADEDLFYFKTTDGGGFPTIRAFRFQEVQQEQPSQAVTRDDINALYKEIDALREAIHGKQPVQPAEKQ